MRRSAWRSSSFVQELDESEDELSESVFQTFRVQIQAAPARSSVMRRPRLDSVILLHHEGEVPDRFRLDPRSCDRFHWSSPFRFQVPNRLPSAHFHALARGLDGGQDQLQSQVEEVHVGHRDGHLACHHDALVEHAVEDLANRNSFAFLQFA
jgi:hypothetical protein